MAIRRDSKIEKELVTSGLQAKDDFRKFLLSEWMKESVGTQYRYFVETLSDGKRVYLERPGRLNKGCDFVIFIEGLFVYKNGNDKPPSHKDLLIDLQNKRRALNQECWNEIVSAIEKVHKTNSYNVSLGLLDEINSVPVMSLEQILHLCKWFFIEQDLTYWSGEGRDMLLKVIKSIGQGQNLFDNKN